MRICNFCKTELIKDTPFYLCFYSVMGKQKDYYYKTAYIDVCENCFNSLKNKN